MTEPKIKNILIPYNNDTVYAPCIKTEDGWCITMTDEVMKVLETNEIRIDGIITVKDEKDLKND
jgi:hypothetical protein